MKKRLISFILTLLFCFALSTTAFAANTISTEKLVMQNKIVNVMQKKYSTDETVRYVVYDADGHDISSYFNNLSKSKASITTKDLTLMPENIKKFVRITEYTHMTRGSDIAKTHVEDVVEARWDIVENARVDVTIDYTVTGTIYYNPNTYVLSGTLGPKRSVITFSSPVLLTGTVDFTSTNVIKEVDQDTYYAYFYHCNTIIGERQDGAENYDFGEIETEFTIDAE